MEKTRRHLPPQFLDGTPAYFDVTVRNSLLPQFVSIAATKPGAAAEAGEREKDGKHYDDVTRTGTMFFPLAVESLGLWSPSSLEILKTIARRAALTSQMIITQLVCCLHQQLSICLWRHNSRLLLDKLSLMVDSVGHV